MIYKIRRKTVQNPNNNNNYHNNNNINHNNNYDNLGVAHPQSGSPSHFWSNWNSIQFIGTVGF